MKNNSLSNYTAEQMDEARRNHFKINLMHAYLLNFGKSPFLRDLLSKDASRKVRTVRRMFTDEQMEQMAVELPRWLGLITGNGRSRNYREPSPIMKSLEHNLIHMKHVHWFALIIIVSELKAKPAR